MVWSYCWLDKLLDVGMLVYHLGVSYVLRLTFFVIMYVSENNGDNDCLIFVTRGRLILCIDICVLCFHQAPNVGDHATSQETSEGYDYLLYV